jgi:hypothetical protein
MNTALLKTCGSCDHSTPSTVENMTGFMWCMKRQQAGRSMEAVFHNPDWQRQCVAFSSLAGKETFNKDAVIPSTESMTSSIPMVVQAAPIPVKAAPSPVLKAKASHTPDLFSDLFI